jgi:hypothetical protein
VFQNPDDVCRLRGSKGDFMSKILFGTAAVAICMGFAAPAFAAANICISTRDIQSSTPKDDGSAITFKMRDGSVWRNDLNGRCPDLKFDGFAWTIRNPGETVCENEQTIRVLRSGEICQLGKFTQITPPRAKMEKHAAN